MLGVNVLLAATAATATWLPTVSARLDRTEAHVGDAVRLHVIAIHRRDVAVNLPTRPDLEKLAILGSTERQMDLKDGRLQTEFVLRVAAYELGEHVVPPIDVVAVGPDRRVHAVPTEALSLRIESLLANVPDPQPKPAAPPVSVMERDLRPLWVGGGIVLVALVGLAILWLHRWLTERARRRSPPPPEPPHVVALRRLAALRGSDLLDRGDFDAYYGQLSLAVRDYLGGRYEFLALDMTTTEIREVLTRVRTDLGPTEIEGFLAACDLVKFARHRPRVETARHALEQAVSLVERTRDVEGAPAA